MNFTVSGTLCESFRWELFLISLQSLANPYTCSAKCTTLLSREVAFRQWTCSTHYHPKLLRENYNRKAHIIRLKLHEIMVIGTPFFSSCLRWKRDPMVSTKPQWWIINSINFTCRLVLNYLWVYISQQSTLCLTWFRSYEYKKSCFEFQIWRWIISRRKACLKKAFQTKPKANSNCVWNMS